ncbi:MAG TPA: hypothetical protein VF131_10030 [Blastocatellia bacterium]|nr:hypothetical protein [Blastocatellia bacterium]
MDQETDHINELDTLESLLGDIERAMTEEGSMDEGRKRELEQLREQCIIKKKELSSDKG